MIEVIREREIKVLEYNEIRQRLAALAATPMARAAAQQLTPSADLAVVERRLKETGEGRLLSARGSFSPQAVEDIEPFVLRASKGGMLKGTELAAVAGFLKGVRRWQRFFKDTEADALYPLLAGRVFGLDGCPGLGRELERAIDTDGTVLNEASLRLAALRRQQRALQERTREKLDSYLRDPSLRRYLQENLITIRGGRYVLPVKQEYRHRVEGVLHDQSASGATLFIEPMAVVKLQNELASLQNQAEQEIERILYRLSALTAEAGEALLGDRGIYTALDLAVACGRLSLEQGGVEPRLLSGGAPRLHLEQARHPLLAGPAVPLTVSMDAERRVLVITGPNTGGKTVALKTIGLMTIMAQSGLHIPAGDQSGLFVFDCIRADIGDEQSIVQSLSTFSAHFKNIISILDEAGPASLVLFDELGAGTDPSEGAALAMAILSGLARGGTLTVATTHSNELKLFAQAREGMQNAAMEFDGETLAPTYRLLQGVPGQSNAFVIAGKLGLPERILEQARGFLHREHAQVESVIASLVEDQQRLLSASSQAAQDRARTGVILQDLEREREKLRDQREEILRQAREEARYLVRRAKQTIDQLVRELQQLRTAGVQDGLSRAEGVRQALHRLRRETQQGTEEEEAPVLPREELAAGKTVLVHSLRQKGEILSLSGEEAVVQVGPMKVHVSLHDLRRWKGKGGPEKTVEPAARSGFTVQKSLNIGSEIDLRGVTVEEALPSVDKLLDNAAWAGLSQVTIIHGKGTGKLKEGLHAYLREHHLVEGFRGGVSGEGGGGVTVVTLRS